jgi:uncharacterized membrane protein YgdD (TMEM256/DUF423 family)
MDHRDGASGVLTTGAILAGLGVAAGALGSHALRGILLPEQLAVFETAVRYQMYHALALIATGILMAGAEGRASRLFRYASIAFTAGIMLFSGSLYLLTLSGMRWPGIVTPGGGLCFLAGWALFALGCRRQAGSGPP